MRRTEREPAKAQHEMQRPVQYSRDKPAINWIVDLRCDSAAE